MPANLITDPISQGNYYTEYLSMVLRYKDQVRKGGYVRYYNVDRNLLNDNATKSILKTRDHHFEVYEYTPTWAIDEVTDQTEVSDETKLKFNAVSSVTVFTIDHPTIHDLVAFVYPPYTSNHVFRVKGIATVLRERDAGLRLFKLELEYAYDVDVLDELVISNHSVYSTFDGRYLPLDQYTNIMNERTIIQNTLDSMQSSFDTYTELYLSNTNDVDMYNNSQLYTLLTSNKAIQQYFTASIPYGVVSSLGSVVGSTSGSTAGTVVGGVIDPKITNVVPSSLVIKTEDYVFDSATALSDVVSMLLNFSG